jgi:predicted 3-demethylubiquinone-9 3-methyltransferase (glyoxalase superfamily)
LGEGGARSPSPDLVDALKEQKRMRTIKPCLWFDHQAEEASNFYASIFENGEVLRTDRYGENTPGEAGTVMSTLFRIADQEFMTINGGPIFSLTPAVSYFVSCPNEADVERLWSALSDGGAVLMPLDAYPFSPKFGWTNDKYGVSWQVSLGGERQTIAPYLLFTGPEPGRAAEAVDFYVSLFENSTVIQAAGPAQPAIFSLSGERFMAFYGGDNHPFTFTEANSFFVSCKTAAEVDRLWDALIADGGEPSQCGWLKDKFGVSWQIVPEVLGNLMADEDREKANRVVQAMLKMSKIDSAKLLEAYEGEPAEA